MERLKIGTITKPQALKGAFRVKPLILDLKKFKKLKEVYINNEKFIVESVVLRDSFVIMKVENIDSCESAESLRNASVEADMEIEKDNNFDLVGFEVKVGQLKGVVKDIQNFGSKDIMTINFDKSCMLPVIDGLIENIDNNAKIITLNSEIFEQVVVYED